jgi:hypothetical protein
VRIDTAVPRLGHQMRLNDRKEEMRRKVGAAGLISPGAEVTPYHVGKKPQSNEGELGSPLRAPFQAESLESLMNLAAPWGLNGDLPALRREGGV